MDNRDYIEKWLAGTLTEQERDQFMKTDAFQSLQRMDHALKQFKPAPFDSRSVYENIKSRASRKTKVRVVDWRMVYRIAATLVLGAVILYFLSDSFSTDPNVYHATQVGETRQVTLPDNSVVTLNALSSVSFSVDDWNQERKIVLEGEAYFDVEKGKSFTVHTTQGEVTVLGTRFSVKDRPGFYEVMCYEGRVEVKGAGEPVQLTAQNYYRQAEGAVTRAAMTPETAPAWLNRESAFERVPFLEVVRELERQYGVVVNINQADTLPYYTGTFPHNDLTTALQVITRPLNLSYRIHDKEIHIFANEE